MVLQFSKERLSELWNSRWRERIIIAVIFSMLILGHALFGTVAVDINCHRSVEGMVNCSLTKQTIIRSKQSVFITDVRAVDIYSFISNPNSTDLYQVELVNSDERNRTFLLYLFDSSAAFQSVRDINAFFRTSDKLFLSYGISNQWNKFSIRQFFSQAKS